MDKFKIKSSNDIMMDLKNMEIEFQNLKKSILNDYDRLEEIQKEYNKAYKEMIKRLNGDK